MKDYINYDIKIYMIGYVVMAKMSEYYYIINRTSSLVTSSLRERYDFIRPPMKVVQNNISFMGRNSVIYVAKNDTAFMKYFINNINVFHDLLIDIFVDMFNSPKSRYANIFCEASDIVNKYDIFIDDVWDYCVEDVCDVLCRLSYEEFGCALEGKYHNNKCDDNMSSISIFKCKKSDIMLN